MIKLDENNGVCTMDMPRNKPTQKEREKHEATHVPFKDWCRERREAAELHKQHQRHTN